MVVAVHSAIQQHLLLLLLAAIAIHYAADAATQPNPNCTKTCGSLSIPFPFGTTEDCALDSTFLIDCNKTISSSGSNPNSSPTPYLPQTNFSVLNISLEGELRISSPVATDCYAQKGRQINQTFPELNLNQFSISSSRNKLRVVGCDTIGLLVAIDSNGKNYTTGCVSLCNKLDDIVANGTCTGTGCCEIPMPGQGLSDLSYGTTSLKNHTGVLGFNPCGYAFPVEDGAYYFLTTDLVKFENTTLPVVLDWAVGNMTCQQAQKNYSRYACKADNSECYNSTKGHGYLCNCSTGFHGNPYILNGCQDIDECRESNICYSGAICHNFPGSYNCSCPDGYDGNGRKDGTKCVLKYSSKSNSRTQIILIIALSMFLSLITLTICSSKLK